MSTLASLEHTQLDVLPGERATCGLTVRNNGDIVESYRLEVVGPPGAWATVEPATLSLYPGSEETATVTFSPPRSSRVPAGETPFAVRVLPTERPQFAVAPEGVVGVLPFVETTAEIIPRTSKCRRKARHEVAVDNRGNVPIVAAVAGGDPDNQLAVSARPATVTVPPGQAIFTTVTVRARQRLWHGAPVTRPFQVMVTPPEGEQPIPLDAGTVQLPVFPKYTGKLVAALAALAVLLVAGWFLLLKPAVSSAARDAVAKPLAQVSKQAKDAQQKAEDAKAAAAGKSPAPAPPSPSASAGTPLMLPLTPNSAANSAGNSAKTVPARHLFVLTDMVLQNPQGDTGRLDLIVDEDTVLTFSLANFRDLDYHFVTAIEVPAGKTVTVKVSCQTPGPALAGTSGSRCRESVLVLGVNRTNAA